jgi:cytoskeleton protein RodZ
MTTANPEIADAEPAIEQVAQPVFEAPPAVAATPAQPAPIKPTHDESLGQRLRAAREARGLTCEAAAQALKLPVAIVQALETERFERIGHAIYLRGYLTKYLHMLDLPQVLAERVLQQRAVEPPPLVTTGTISRPRYLFERYSGSALYLILTGVIVVPAVLLAMRAGFDQNLVRVAPLDTQEATTPIATPHEESSRAATSSTTGTPAATASATTTAPETNPSSIIASMTPFPAQTAAETTTKPTQPSTPTAPGEHTLRLTLAEASWVEIVAADGQKVEYGMLAAGSTHNYVSAKVLDVRVGNANGATFEVDGKATDLSPYRHSNVAHFRIADGAATASHSGG